MKKIIFKDSQEIVLNHVDIKKVSEEIAIEKHFQKKCEKKLDYVYLISSYRDSVISKLQNKISSINNKKQDYLNLNEYKFKNLDITKTEYEKNIKEIESGKFKSTSLKINSLNNKINRKKNKWDKLISKRSISNKKSITIYNEKKQKQLDLIYKKTKSLLDDIDKNKIKIQELDKKYYQDKVNKFENDKYSTKLKKLEIDLENKTVGPLEYQDKKNICIEKRDLVIDKTNAIVETKFSKRFSWKINTKFAFSFINKKKAINKTLGGLNAIKLVFIIMAFAVVVGIIEPGFFTPNNWKNILYLNADIGCMALGVTVIILTGGIDLSIGSTMAFATALAAKLILGGTNIWISLLAVIMFCGFSGLISGLFVSVLKFPSFIITLILMMVWRGATQFLLENTSQSFDNSTLTSIIQTKFLGLSAVVWIMFLLAALSFVILRLTVYGRHVYAIGGNYRSAQLSGIKSKTILTSVYVFGGLCIGIGSVIYASRIQTASPSAGNAWELDAIACVVLGGTLLTGGKGGIFLTVLGWFTLSVLKNALNLIGLSSDIQSILKGLIIMVAVLSNTEYKITNKIKTWIIKQYTLLKTI
ncbi:ribose ABC transporter permease [Spiroplasma corruscae]|uniref:Ribose ABC transporter permease n=1 Tax=Spiroplasma corruscae TaxID=216934 RepID=A0A222EPI9_9MOLU|nr:ABC transporter permease [Spiroplasma corruscae]ASP28437.1 ribose ABC transporter permease [Spiroplasma corruscae]